MDEHAALGTALTPNQPEWTPKVDNPPKKKSKKPRGNKSAAKRGPTALPANRGTGFEPYFADPPMTPAEAEEERTEIYAIDLPFEERIQSCIQRFRSRRRLQGNQTRYFNEYLFLGGIDTNPTPFTGNDPKDLKQMTATEQYNASAELLGGNEERFYTGDRTHWSVDFAGIAAGFFSSMCPITGNDPSEANMAIAVVENFLRYILYHDVCPEYTDDVNDALEVCNAAKKETPMLLRLSSSLPGYFNLAAARAFNRHDQADWAILADSDAATRESEQMKKQPLLVLQVASCLMDDIELFNDIFADLTSVQDLRVSESKDFTVQVSQIFPPTPLPDDQELKCSIPGYAEHIGTNLVGAVNVIPAPIETEWEEVCLPFQTFDGTLYFEESILKNLKVGMKMTLEVFQVEGHSFVKTLKNVVPSYYTFLPQQMMRYFKTPGPSSKPAPSIHTVDDQGDVAMED